MVTEADLGTSNRKQFQNPVTEAILGSGRWIPYSSCRIQLLENVEFQTNGCRDHPACTLTGNLTSGTICSACHRPPPQAGAYIVFAPGFLWPASRRPYANEALTNEMIGLDGVRRCAAKLLGAIGST